MYRVYKYTNKINGKIHIGQTRNTLEERAQANGINYSQNPRFYAAIKEFGWDNFEGEIIIDNLSKEEAYEYEKYYISLYESYNPEYGYNVMKGVHAPCVDEIKDKLSAQAIERYKDSTKNPMYGKKHTEKSLKKMSEVKKGSKNPMYGKPVSKETIEKRKQTNKERGYTYTHEWTDEQRKSASERFKQVAKRWMKSIRCIEDDNVFESITAAANYYHCSSSTISDYLLGKQKSCANGRHFEYLTKE